MQSRQVFKEKNMPRKVKPSKRYLALRKKISDAKLLAAKQSVTRPEQDEHRAVDVHTPRIK
jgi:hypothetical protein